MIAYLKIEPKDKDQLCLIFSDKFLFEVGSMRKLHSKYPYLCAKLVKNYIFFIFLEKRQRKLYPFYLLVFISHRIVGIRKLRIISVLHDEKYPISFYI